MNNPPLIPQAFATNGSKNTIQDTRQAGQAEEDATWSSGFPNVTMQPSESGGLPPKGMDFNGIFNAISSPIVHLQKGGAYKFDSDYAAKIGGYSIGSVLQSNDGLSSYVSLIDNNTTDFNSNPDSIGTAWGPWAGDAVSSSFANELSKKVDKVIDGKNIAYIVDSYRDDSGNWYRKWSDGWLEQGGYKNATAIYAATQITFPMPFLQISFVTSAIDWTSSHGWYTNAASSVTNEGITDVSGAVADVTLTGCKLQLFNAKRWYACGKGA